MFLLKKNSEAFGYKKFPKQLKKFLVEVFKRFFQKEFHFFV